MAPVMHLEGVRLISLSKDKGSNSSKVPNRFKLVNSLHHINRNNRHSNNHSSSSRSRFHKDHPPDRRQ
jgi:hypothetical protein